MFTQQFLESLHHNLREPLPGQEAQYHMAPRPRSGRLPYDHSPTTARRSGVLILFYPYTGTNDDSRNGANDCGFDDSDSGESDAKDNGSNNNGSNDGCSRSGTEEIYLPLILRSTYRGVHSGQVGFPGGGWEEGDTDIIATALRETHEEIGVPTENIHVIGQLSPLYVFASNHLVHPTVGWIDRRPDFHLDRREVAQLIEIPLRELLNPANLRIEEWQLRDRTAKVPFYYIQEQTIWGATAMMLSELLALPAIAQIAKSIA